MIEYGTQKELEEVMNNGSYELSKIICEKALELYSNDEESIDVVEISSCETSVIHKIQLDREDLLITLKAQLKVMEEYEDYRMAAKLFEALKNIKE